MAGAKAYGDLCARGCPSRSAWVCLILNNQPTRWLFCTLQMGKPGPREGKLLQVVTQVVWGSLVHIPYG